MPRNSPLSLSMTKNFKLEKTGIVSTLNDMRSTQNDIKSKKTEISFTQPI